MANAEERLRKVLDDVAKKEDYKLNKIDINPITSGGANYTSDLYVATISESLKPDINVFAKVANLPEEARKNNEFLSRVYETEAMFYSEMAVNFENIYNKYQVPIKDRLVMCKCYGHVLDSYEEILVMENLAAKGFGSFDRMKTFNWDYAASSVTQIAKFHALGLSFRKEYPQEFEKVYSTLIADFIIDQEMMENFMQQAIQDACEILDDGHKQRLLNFFSSKDNMTQVTNLMMGEDKTMLVHGDFRPSNLMHRRRNGKLEVIILDYQTLRIGNPVLDLIYFVFSGSDQKFRHLYYKHLLEHYYTQLTLALRHLNIDVEDVYPRNKYDGDLSEWKPAGLVIGLTMSAMVTVNPEDAPKLESDISNIQVKPNKLAQERIIGIVKDYVKWGVL